MKPINFYLLVLCLLCGGVAQAQIAPAVTHPSGSFYWLNVIPAPEFHSGNFPTPDREAWYSECDASNNLGFQVNWGNFFLQQHIQYKIKFYRHSFDPNTGTPAFDHDNGVFVAGSPTFEMTPSVNTNLGLSYEHYINVLPNQLYFARLFVRQKAGIGWKAWEEHNTNQINIVSNPGTPQAVASFSHQSTVQLPSFYGTTEVKEFDINQPILLDGSASTCDQQHQVIIEEYDLLNWQPLGGPVNNPAWSFLPAGVVNLNSIAVNGLEQGTVYHVALAIGPDWDTDDHFIRVKEATIGASIPFESTQTVSVPVRGGLYEYYHVKQVCDNIVALNLNTAGTDYEGEYQVSVSRLDNQMDVVPNTTIIDGWNSGEAPASINLSTHYTPGFTNWNFYQVDFSVRNPEQTETIYFEMISCPQGNRRLAVDRPNEMATPAIRLFPNPSEGVFTVELPAGVNRVKYELYSVLGRQLTSGTLDVTDNTLDLNHQPDGIYLLHVEGQVHRLIKQ